MVKIKKGISLESEKKAREDLERSPLAAKVERELYKQEAISKKPHVRAVVANVNAASALFDQARGLLFAVKDTQAWAEEKTIMPKDFIEDMRRLFNEIRKHKTHLELLRIAHDKMRKKFGLPATL